MVTSKKPWDGPQKDEAHGVAAKVIQFNPRVRKKHSGKLDESSEVVVGDLTKEEVRVLLKSLDEFRSRMAQYGSSATELLEEDFEKNIREIFTKLFYLDNLHEMSREVLRILFRYSLDETQRKGLDEEINYKT